MRLLFSAVAVTASLVFAATVLAQSTPAPATATPPAAAAAPAGSTAAVPVAMGKRLACQTASQGMTGQDKRDRMQLCMAQAHLDCLKQAIDQKIVGPQRKDFVKSCVQ